MNGRAPAYKKCNEVTLVKVLEDGQLWFKTFWKNVHQQFMISEGVIYGCTYKVFDKDTKVVTKESGNDYYIACRCDGWVKWEEYCRDNGLNCLLYDMGRILI